MRRRRYSYNPLVTSLLKGAGGQHHAPAVLTSGKSRYPLYRGLGGRRDRSGWARKISLQSRFDPLNRPGNSQSLCQLGYIGHQNFVNIAY